MEVALAGEGRLDLAILERLLAETGLTPGRVLGGGDRGTGKYLMDKRLAGWAAGAATGAPFVVLRDLDQDAGCAGDLRARLLPDPPATMAFRIAVRAAEAWLIADRERLAAHLTIRAAALLADPDADLDLKRTLLDAVSRSSRSTVKRAMLPRPGSGRRQGDDYADTLAAFVRGAWTPREAAKASDSLHRALLRLDDLRVRLAPAP